MGLGQLKQEQDILKDELLGNGEMIGVNLRNVKLKHKDILSI
jgi:hypothetical protein